MTDDHAHSDPSSLSRRSFLGRGAAAGLGITLAGSLVPLVRAAGTDHPARPTGPAGYGPLVTDPAGRLSLPAGFAYSVVAESGVTRLDSGEVTPDNPDGTGSFVRHGGSGTVLVVNHEVRAPSVNVVPHLAGLTYDEGLAAASGTTTLEVDGHGNRVREYVSLAGTVFNCAGGRTPWHTWLSCEETDLVPTATNRLLRRHGYVFEVDPYRPKANLDPVPLAFLGRFEHEALAVDPETGRIYETEDATNPHGLLFRWTPPDEALPLERGSLRGLAAGAGVFEAMRARDASGAVVGDLCVATEPGTTYAVEWVPVPDRDAATVLVRRQFNGEWRVGTRTVVVTDAEEVTRSRKLEGIWWGDGGAYVVASFARTADGSTVQHDGQVWFHDPAAETLRLVLRFAFDPADDGTATEAPDGPDNITLFPHGGVLVAEDGEGAQHLVGATEDGETFYVARNDLPGSAEMTGPTFSHNKKTLFANVYVPGHVFAVTGPWRR